MKWLIYLVIGIFLIGLVSALPNDANNRIDFDYTTSGTTIINQTNVTNYYNQFDQSLNTTDDVSFNSIYTPYIYADTLEGDGSLITGISGSQITGIPNIFNQVLNTSSNVAHNRINASIFYIPTTSNSTYGVIYQNGQPFIHSYGSSNFFAGLGAGNFVLTGSPGGNFGLGSNALNGLRTGNRNMAIGVSAMQFIANGSDNACIGSACLFYVNNSNANVGLGSDSGRSITGGGGNTFVGYEAGYTDNNGFTTKNNLGYGGCIGAYCQAKEDNHLVLGGMRGFSSASGSIGTLYRNDTKWSVFLLYEDTLNYIYRGGYSGNNATHPTLITTFNVSKFGDIYSNSSISTDNNEFLKHDAIRHTITSGEASGGTFFENWNKTTKSKVVSMTAVVRDAGDTIVTAQDWTAYHDLALSYNGTAIIAYPQGASGYTTGEIVTIYMVYEK